MIKFDLYSKDKLAEIISDRFKWSPLRTAVYAFIWTWINQIVLAVLNGRFLPAPGYTSFTEAYYHHFSTLPIAFAWGYYVWLHKAPANVIKELQSSGVVTIDTELFKKTRGIVNRKSNHIIAIIMIVLASAVNFYQDLTAAPVWHNGSTTLLVIRYVTWNIPTAYVVVMALIQYLTYTQVFRLVLKDVKLHPLHPDRSGGLRPLGRYALISTYPLAVAGSVAAVAIYWSYINNEIFIFYYLGAIAYLILAPWIFFAPLSSAHNAMLNAKNDLKAKISRQFNNDYSLAYDEISGSASQLKDNLEKLEQLQKMDKIADSFPVWPFDIQIIRRFILTMLSPLLGVLISILTNYINNKLFPD